MRTVHIARMRAGQGVYMVVTQNRIAERFRGIVGRASVGGVVWRGSRLGALGAVALMCALWRGLRSRWGVCIGGARGRRLWAEFGARGEWRNVGQAWRMAHASRGQSQRGRTERTRSEPRPHPTPIKSERGKWGCYPPLPLLKNSLAKGY